ncbi:MAG: ATP-binding protein [Kiloniellales bacterium]|nr:ATP-binding protein [Kiloniellales bacterium]MDJ0970027.1 ATP-binding protein [Kiloniellales bacterium]MDJ0980577.1 ATP-binding protein [Kiloniellales bacterium]
MTGTSAKLATAGELPAEVILNTLAQPLVVVDGEDRLTYVNQAAEQFFAASANALLGRPLRSFVQADSPLFDSLRQARDSGHSLFGHEVALASPRLGQRLVSLSVTAIPESQGNGPPGQVIVSFDERSIARKMGDQLVHRNAARSVTAMAAILAHEVKNPLSGIRGAAQLLEGSVAEPDQELTRLICSEADRIVHLVNRMEMFSSDQPIEREPVNIHEVLEYVRRVSQSGIAQGHRIVERYDPSLPPVHGNRDMLIQALLNLVKNAAEAAQPEGGEIVMTTRYKQGLRLTAPAGGDRLDLPLVVTVQDNGPGIPEELRRHLFDPFVTTKPGGRGLGLALVAKVVSDHGGVIECDSEPGRTLFRLQLPLYRGEAP